MCRQLIVSILALFSVPGGGSVAFAEEGPAQVLAVVNDVAITRDDYAARVGAQPGDVQASYRPLILNDLVNRELVVQDGARQGFDDDPEFLEIVDRLRYNALFNYGLQKYYERHPVTEPQLRDAYQRLDRLAQYKLRHIVVPDSEQAAAIVSALQQGGRFAELASRHSRDPMTSARGGELGWLVEGQMFEPVAEAVRSLSKGDVTQQPVHTEAGWHVVMLEDRRDLPPLPFEKVRDQLLLQERQKLTDAYLRELRAQASIQLTDPS